VGEDRSVLLLFQVADFVEKIGHVRLLVFSVAEDEPTSGSL
jgi:hypothetical protein